jgi:hypothetical protein
MDRSEFSALLNQGEDTWLDWKRDFPRGLLGGRSHPDANPMRYQHPKYLIGAPTTPCSALQGSFCLTRQQGWHCLIVGSTYPEAGHR